MVRRWLRTVSIDMRAIASCIDGPEPSPEAAAYHCQQAAEKLVKARLVHRGIDPPKLHSIAALIALLPADDAFASVFKPFVKFTAFGYAYRYPSPLAFEPEEDPPSDADLRAWLAELTDAEAKLRAALLPPPARE